MNKLLLLKINDDLLYDKAANPYWTSLLPIPCSGCKEKTAIYFSKKANFCADCVIIVTLLDIMESQMFIIKARERREQKEQKALAARQLEEVEIKAATLYASSSNYDKEAKQYYRPDWIDVPNRDKDRFYHMAEYIISNDLREDES